MISPDLKADVEHYLRTAAPHVRARKTYHLLKKFYEETQVDPPPVRMLLACPVCARQHIDRPDPEKNWTNPPHRTHQCQHCGHLWRPADVPTEGVERIETRGENDGRALPEVVTIEDRQKELEQWYQEWRPRARGVNYFPSVESFLKYCKTRLCVRTF